MMINQLQVNVYILMRIIVFAQQLHMHNTQLHNPWYLVPWRRLDDLLYWVNVVRRRQLQGVVTRWTGTHNVRVPTSLTKIMSVRNATFSHHFRTPCLNQGPPSSQPNWLLSLGVANNSLLALAATPFEATTFQPSDWLLSLGDANVHKLRERVPFGYQWWLSNKY